MGGIASSFSVNPTSLTIAAASINTTTLATAVTVGYQDKPCAMLWISNHSSTPINLGRVPITIDGQGTTVAGTIKFWDVIPAGAYKAYDFKSDGVHLGPNVWKIYADATPASGTVVIIPVPNK